VQVHHFKGWTSWLFHPVLDISGCPMRAYPFVKE
jgi:hypothetical protein